MSVQAATECCPHPYRVFKAASLDACCGTCSADPECQAFTFHASGLSCVLSLTGPASITHHQGAWCGSRSGPSPPSPPPSGLDPALDCGMRQLALAYGQQKLGDSARVTAVLGDALQLERGCNITPKSTPDPRPRPHPHPHPSHRQTDAWRRLRAANSIDYYVSAMDGNDSNSGTTAQTAWRTLDRVLQALAASGPPASRPQTTVHLLPGTFYLNDTLRLDGRHSGATAASPVIFAATEPGTVTISGGRNLTGRLAWTPAPNIGAGVFQATLPPSAVDWRFESLFADGRRQLRARFPNGNPEDYCPRDLHGGQCPGFAQAGSTVTKPSGSAGSPVAGAPNVHVYSQQSGQLLVTGFMYPLSQSFVFNVTSPHPSWETQAPTWSAFQAFQGGQLSRFDLNNTLAFWNTGVPDTMNVRSPSVAGGWTNKTWSHPEDAVMHIYQTAYWGGWMFRLSSVDTKKLTVTFSEGGFQEARGGTIGGNGERGVAQDYYVENVLEELDAAREWFYDARAGKLYWQPPAGTDPASAELVAPALETLVSVVGASASDPAQHIRFDGCRFQHTLPTFMQPHEPTAGGDWSLHRGGAIFVENTTDLVISNCNGSALEGNGVVLSGAAKNCSLTGNELFDIGATPVVLVGRAALMDARAGLLPSQNTISNNHLHHFGVWGRQSAGYFEGQAMLNVVRDNVIHDGPRAGANFNDGCAGGLLFQGNLLFNVVLDSSEHGTTNSWDRQPFLYLDANYEVQLAPIPRRIHNNFVFRNSFRGPTSNKWALDKDDGSSNYVESDNVLVYGAIKDRDGRWRTATGNLLVYPDKMPFPDTTHTDFAMAFQVSGFSADEFSNNTVITSLGAIYSCTQAFGPKSTAITGNNTFLTPNQTALPFAAGGCAATPDGLKGWQALGYDHGSTQSAAPLTAAETIAMARRWLGM